MAVFDDALFTAQGGGQFHHRAVTRFEKLTIYCQYDTVLPMYEMHTESGRRLTALILETFRLNGRLLSAGDRLVGDLGLSSARWQILGALALEGRPLTVAQIGRRMGLSRQAVQRVVNDLVSDDVLELRDNPDHKRAKLVVLSQKGTDVYSAADARQVGWVNELGEGLSLDDLDIAGTVLREILRRLEEANPEGEA